MFLPNLAQIECSALDGMGRNFLLAMDLSHWFFFIQTLQK